MFRHINCKEADLGGITIMGEVVVAPAAVVRRFGKPSAGEGYKVSGEYAFLNDLGQAFVLHDWLSTNLCHPDGPAPDTFWAIENLTPLSVSSLDLEIAAFATWLATQLD